MRSAARSCSSFIPASFASVMPGCVLGWCGDGYVDTRHDVSCSLQRRLAPPAPAVVLLLEATCVAMNCRSMGADILCTNASGSSSGDAAAPAPAAPAAPPAPPLLRTPPAADPAPVAAAAGVEAEEKEEEESGAAGSPPSLSRLSCSMTAGSVRSTLCTSTHTRKSGLGSVYVCVCVCCMYPMAAALAIISSDGFSKSGAGR